VGHEQYRYLEIPGGSGICSARALAKLAAAVANVGQLDGARILSEEVIAEMHGEVVARTTSAAATTEVTLFDKGGFCHFE